MAGHARKWNGTLNVGRLIGGMGCGAIVGAITFTNVDPNNIPTWAVKASVLAVIGGAYVGTVIWAKLFSKDS